MILFVVVGLVVENGKGPVELFGKEEADHLVGEGHLREGEGLLGLRPYRGAEAVGAADEEDYPPRGAIDACLQPGGELHGAHLPSTFVKEDKVIARLDLAEDEFALFFFLLSLGQVLRVSQVGYNLDAKIGIVRKPGGVVFQAFGKVLFRGFAHNEKNDLHVENSGSG